MSPKSYLYLIPNSRNLMRYGYICDKNFGESLFEFCEDAFFPIIGTVLLDCWNKATKWARGQLSIYWPVWTWTWLPDPPQSPAGSVLESRDPGSCGQGWDETTAAVTRSLPSCLYTSYQWQVICLWWPQISCCLPWDSCLTKSVISYFVAIFLWIVLPVTAVKHVSISASSPPHTGVKTSTMYQNKISLSLIILPHQFHLSKI